MKYNSLKIIIFSLIFIMLFSVTGCWDNRDLTDMSLVCAVGIDITENKRYEVTVQLVKPGTIVAIKKGSTEKAFWTYSATGETVFEGIRNILQIVDKKPYYSHMLIMVIGEEVARDGIMNVLDVFSRNHETRQDAFLLITTGISAKELLNVKSNLDNIPAVHLESALKNGKNLARIININIINFLSCVGKKGKNPIASSINPITKTEDISDLKDLDIEGAAVFKKDKLVGFLDPKETRGYMFVDDKVKGGVINISNPVYKENKVAIEIRRVKSKLDAKIVNNNPIMSIEIDFKGEFGGQQGPGNLTLPKNVKQLEKEVEKAIEEEIKCVIDCVQKEYESDIFGFGEVLHRKHPDYWNDVKGNWDSEFKEIKIKVKVNATLLRPGLVKKSIEPR